MLSESDSLFFFQLNSDPEVIRYTGDDPFADVAEAGRFLRAYDPYRRFQRGRMAMQLRETGELIGWCGLKYDEKTDKTDIGYRLFRRHWNQGFATEAAMAAIQDGFLRLDLQVIFAHVHTDNRASIRVTEKLGMNLREEYEWGGSLWRLMDLTQADWAARGGYIFW